MATVYKFEIVSHWINYHPDDMKKMIEKALYSCENEITVNNLDHVYKCNKCGAEYVGFTTCCTMPNSHRTSGICGGLELQNI